MKRIKLGRWEIRLARSGWFESRDMEGDFASFIVGELREILGRYGCAHGHNSKDTAPMFYPEAICCALHHQREQGRILGRAEALTAEKPKEGGA